MSARLFLAVFALGLAGCAALPPPPPTSTELTYLVRSAPPAALDSVAAWAAGSDDLALARSDDGLVIRDRRRGQENEARVAARALEGGVTEVTVRSRYVTVRSFRDLGVALFLGLGAYGVPVEGSPSCFPRDEWEAGPAAPPADDEAPEAAGEERHPELIGGLAGLERRVEYSDTLRAARASGVVLVQFVVDETGAVECAQALTSPHPELMASALAAVRASEFRPGIQGGEPVSVRFMVPVTYFGH